MGKPTKSARDQINIVPTVVLVYMVFNFKVIFGGNKTGLHIFSFFINLAEVKHSNSFFIAFQNLMKYV